MKVDKKDIETASLSINLLIKICLLLQVKYFFLYMGLGLGFEIRKRVLIEIYSCWKAPGIAGFGNKLCKRETPIIEAAGQPFFDREKDK